MADKKYYWLKFQHDFFSSKRMKKLRSLAGGDTFTIIYLKMQLKSLETDGVLEYTGLEKTFAEEIALDIDEAPDNVGITINYLISCGLMEQIDESHIAIPYAVKNMGSELTSTERVRAFRERKKAFELSETECNVSCNVSCNDSVTQSKSKSNSKSIEKEKEEKEKESSLGDNWLPDGCQMVAVGKNRLDKNRLEKEKDKKEKKWRFTPPTVGEVNDYIKEKGYHFDAESFVAFYESKGWMVGKNKMKDWKQACVTWEKRRKEEQPANQMDEVKRYMREKYGNDI